MIRATIRFAFEPGRVIAANAGVLLASVVHLHERPEGKRFLVLDAAMNDLIRPAMYDAFHDIRPVKVTDGTPVPCDVVGPVCETGDTFTRDRLLPPLGAGDVLAFMSAGAYGAAMASEYNSRPLVPEVLVDGDRFAVIRKRPSYDEMLAAELAQNGLTASDMPGKDVQLIYLAYPDLNQALLGKNLDAIMQTEPQSAQAIRKGFGVQVIKPYDTPIGEPVRTLVMTEKFYNEKPETAQKFLNCFVKATKTFIDNKAVGEKYVTETLFKGQISKEDFNDAIGNSPYLFMMSVVV